MNCFAKPIKTAALSLLTLALSGCATLPETSTEAMDNRVVEYKLTYHTGPAVVFENGLGGTMDWWAEVYPDIARDATAFAYNRPGYGKSSPATTPRDGEHIVDELRAALRSKGLQPPYILVGHSMGGIYMQYFARRYPDEVEALVLVDSTHPEQFKGKGSTDNWPTWLRLTFGLVTSDTAKQELNALNATGEKLLSLPTFTGKPVLVLSAAKPLQDTSDLAQDANEKRRAIATLYPGATQIWVDSGHGIPLEKPEAVIAAIREALSKTVP